MARFLILFILSRATSTFYTSFDIFVLAYRMFWFLPMICPQEVQVLPLSHRFYTTASV